MSGPIRQPAARPWMPGLSQRRRQRKNRCFRFRSNPGFDSIRPQCALMPAICQQAGISARSKLSFRWGSGVQPGLVPWPRALGTPVSGDCIDRIPMRKWRRGNIASGCRRRSIFAMASRILLRVRGRRGNAAGAAGRLRAGLLRACGLLLLVGRRASWRFRQPTADVFVGEVRAAAVRDKILSDHAGSADPMLRLARRLKMGARKAPAPIALCCIAGIIAVTVGL